MDIQSIPVVCVSYNSAELISDLLFSFRKFYKNQIYIIDGSSETNYKSIEEVADKFDNVRFIHFDFNIHHGPGMAWAINNLNLSGRVLFLDSDVCVINHGFIESLNEALLPDMYGVGKINNVNEGGFDVTYEDGAIKYLHPACMLCNIDIMRQWPLPLKHGAPLTETMVAIHKAGATTLLGHIPWLENDFAINTEKKYLRHDWQGTVSRTGGYHLDDWFKHARENAEFNNRLISLIPRNAKRLLEIGASSGELARAYRVINPACNYTSIEIKEENSRLANIFYDSVLHLNCDALDDADFKSITDLQNVDCWIIFNVLESLNDPWKFISKICEIIPRDGCIIASITNSQHWHLQSKLSIGDFRYSEAGILKRKNIRFFTRATIFELFQGSGLKIETGFPRISDEPQNDCIFNAIKQLALSVGADPDLALSDSRPIEYVVKAVFI